MRSEETTVLVVDDDATVRRCLNRQLRRVRCRVLQAGDAEEALSILDAEPVGVLVTDLRMSGLGGNELIRAARRRRPGLRAIVVSGSPEEADAAAPVLPKPWRSAVLRELVLQDAGR